MVLVSVKWQKELYSGIEIDFTEPPSLFKGQLFALTGVPPERQKILVKGGILQDDSDWNKFGIKEGQKLMMMGTADAVPVAPVSAPVFLEDLPEEDQDAAVTKHTTAGLVNLGNTCYMNATLQCLRAVPELRTALKEYSPTAGVATDGPHKLTLATKSVFQELDTSIRAVSPFLFLSRLREQFPRFAEQGERGTYMQQDAEECWTNIIFILSQRLRDPSAPSRSLMDDLFGISLQSVVKCAESAEESTETERVFTLKCHITRDINQLDQGLTKGFEDELTKVSPTLGRSAVFSKTSQIASLPKYLTVQFVRFFWKRESQQKAKILRKVGFPLSLDVYNFCTPELKSKLDEPRKLLRALDDERAETLKAAKRNKKDGNGASGSNPSVNELDVKSGAHTGWFDLVSVLTHKGRSADSGHYVGWVKQDNGNWTEFDDDNTIARREDDITVLSGGGDWHMAYILVYKARFVEVKDSDDMQT